MAERRFDDYNLPRDLQEYLSYNGRHFSKPLYEWAVKMMESRTGEKMRPVEKSTFDERMRANGVSLKRDKGYDGVYVWSMATSDYMGSSITDEAHLAKYVQDYIDDSDGSETRAFDEFYAKTMALGVPVDWASVM